MLGEISAGLSIFDFMTKWSKKLFGRNEPETESIASRFFQLFEEHGVHRNQIPSLIDHGLTIADIQNEETLFKCLNEELLNYVCKLFAVRREWLDGADTQIYPLHDFYKWPERFGEFLDSLLVNKKAYEITGVVLAVKDPKVNDGALIVLEEQVGSVGNKPVYRYHLCNNWTYGYWKARVYLTACVALAWKKNVCLMGRYVEQSLIDRYQSGDVFFEYSIDHALPLRGAHWHPEDMTVKPEAFLDGVDEGCFGKISALDLWLVEEEKGLMDANLPYTNVRQAFESKINELQADRVELS